MSSRNIDVSGKKPIKMQVKYTKQIKLTPLELWQSLKYILIGIIPIDIIIRPETVSVLVSFVPWVGVVTLKPINFKRILEVI